MARSRSGTRGRRGPRKPPRRDGSGVPAQVQVADPRERGAVELPATITVKELAELFAVNPADVIRELIKSGIFATINQLIDRDSRWLPTRTIDNLPPPSDTTRIPRLYRRPQLPRRRPVAPAR